MKNDTIFVENANTDNLALAKEAVNKSLATEEQYEASRIYSGLISNKQACERKIKEYKTILTQVNKELKPFDDAKLPKVTKK